MYIGDKLSTDQYNQYELHIWQVQGVNGFMLQSKRFLKSGQGLFLWKNMDRKKKTLALFQAPTSWFPWATIQLLCQQTHSNVVVQAHSSATY